MRFLQLENEGKISLTRDIRHEIPPYAILSHTWGPDHEEVTFSDFPDGQNDSNSVSDATKSKPGFRKITFCAEKAEKHGLKYFWVDTCCINKADLVELQEAINSMFRWYRESAKCFVYLADVSSRKRDCEGESQYAWQDSLCNSRWFTRGWTLQELLAPRSVDFYSREGDHLGSRDVLQPLIEKATAIPPAALQGSDMSTFGVEERMSWVESRNTTKPEDRVYCLLGIFGVSMSLLYGEGEERALARLKDEIIKHQRTSLDDIKFSFMNTASMSQDQPLTKPNTCPRHDNKLERRRSLMASLFFDQMYSRRATIKNAHAKTCAWFLQHEHYTDWNDRAKLDQHHGFLWIKGKPGVGKSTLMKFAHATAKKTKSRNELLLSFFFNARGEILERSIIGMYRSLTYQLLDKATYLQGILDDDELLFDLNGHSPSWSVEILRDLFTRAVLELQEKWRIRCYIDALDECDERDVQNMIIFFENLAQLSSDRLNICFASRHYPTIVVQNGIELVLEHEQGHAEDLNHYVRSHLRIQSHDLRQELEQRIPGKSNGVFMWAVLVVDILNTEVRRGRIFNVAKRLDEIPAGLSDLFKEILRRDNANMDELLLCLQWILFAKTPLRSREFYHAMMTGVVSTSETIDETHLKIGTDDDIVNFVHDCSKGLAELTNMAKGTKKRSHNEALITVQFIHESVRDFLLKERGLYELWPELQLNAEDLSHERLKNCCQRYLAISLGDTFEPQNKLPTVRSEAAQELRDVLASTFPFLSYASRHIFFHANEAARTISQESFVKSFPVEKWVQKYNMICDKGRQPKRSSLAHHFAENNCGRLISHLSENDGQALLQGGSFRCMFFTALRNEAWDAICAMLARYDHLDLDNVLDQIKKHRRFQFHRDRSPFQWALNNGIESLVEIWVGQWIAQSLLENLGPGGTRCFLADRVLESVLKLGFQNTISQILDSDLLPDRGIVQRCLLYGAKYGNITAVEGILRRTENETDDLSHASCIADVANSVDIVRSPPTEINAHAVGHETNKQTLLFRAVVKRHAEVSESLWEKGALMTVIDAEGKSALMHAAFNGHTGMASLLLKYGADLDLANKDGATALSWAAWNGKTEMVNFLISKAAMTDAHSGVSGDLVKSLDGQHRAPLSYAAGEGHIDIVQILLDSGANIRATNAYGFTAMSMAITFKRANTVKLLLEATAQLGESDPASASCLNYDIRMIDSHAKSSRDWIGHHLSGLLDVLVWADLNDVDLVWQAVVDRQTPPAESIPPERYLALMRAIRSRSAADAQLALQSDVNSVVKHHWDGTVLLYACIVGELDVARIILVSGANVDARTNRSRTALHFAATSGENSTHLLELLLSLGADVNVVDTKGNTPLDYAFEFNSFDAIRLLRGHGANLGFFYRWGTS